MPRQSKGKALAASSQETCVRPCARTFDSSNETEWTRSEHDSSRVSSIASRYYHVTVHGRVVEPGLPSDHAEMKAVRGLRIGGHLSSALGAQLCSPLSLSPTALSKAR